MNIELDINKMLEENETKNIKSSEELINNNYGEWLDMFEDEFSDTIKYRGEDYYKSGNVLNCYKINPNSFIGYVKGSQDKPYKVNIEYEEECDYIDMDCTCPCDFPCKHEYAVLKAISNYEFSDIKLKPEIKNVNDNIKNIIEKIPAEELKKYMLSPEYENYVCFEMTNFENYFKKYMPKQSYDYYYNNLYNKLALDENFEDKTTEYLNEVKKFINGYDFEEGFKIVKAIINAYIDSKRIADNNYLIDQMPVIGMYIRVINRKAKDDLKNRISKWINYLENNNYFNNLYLEDAIEISK